MSATAAAVPDASLATPAALEPWQVLAPDGTIADGRAPSLDDDALLEAYRLMLLSRQVDERAFSLQRQGRLGTFSQASGQEAAIVGSAMALDPSRDWVVPQYRELAAMIRQGSRGACGSRGPTASRSRTSATARRRRATRTRR
jgi:hypothetical protein